MDRASMTVRMVGEKLAREARGTAGADAGEKDRLKAAVHECRTAGTSGNRFIERMYFKVREGVQAGDVEARYINTKLNVSDVMTKGAGREVIAKLQAMLCGREPWPDMPDAEGALRAQLADGWRPDW